MPNYKENISVICIYYNYHIYDIFNKLKDYYNIYNLYFEKIPDYRIEIGWSQPRGDKNYLFRENKIKFLKSMLKSKFLFIVGIANPFPWMVILIFVAIIFNKKIYIISEGFKNKFKYDKKLVIKMMIKILDKKNINCLCIGDQSKNDFNDIGIQNWNFYKFGFFEEYFPGVQIDKSKRKSINILSVGSLSERKNFISIIKILNNYNKKNIINYRIAGNGNLLNKFTELSKKAPKNVKICILRNCDKVRLHSLFQNADIFVLPSKYDGWAVVINQAIAYGLPIIVSRNVRSGKNNLVLHNYNGYIIKNDLQLIKYLEILIKNKHKRNEFGKNSLKIYKEWEINFVARRLINFLSFNNRAYKSGPLQKLK